MTLEQCAVACRNWEDLKPERKTACYAFQYDSTAQKCGLKKVRACDVHAGCVCRACHRPAPLAPCAPMHTHTWPTVADACRPPTHATHTPPRYCIAHRLVARSRGASSKTFSTTRPGKAPTKCTTGIGANPRRTRPPRCAPKTGCGTTARPAPPPAALQEAKAAASGRGKST